MPRAELRRLTDEERIDSALGNLVGTWGKLDDAAKHQPWMTFERAVDDSHDVMRYYLLELYAVLGRPVPEGLAP